MPKPTAPWTTSNALESHIYVLTGKYVGRAAEENIAFYARTGYESRGVRADGVSDFLRQYGDRSFVTYDAADFHHACLRALRDSHPGGDRDSLVWALSQEGRLWDVGLLEMRVNYALDGYTKKTKGTQGFHSLLEKYKGITKPLRSAPEDLAYSLRSILFQQVREAMKHLPLFKTYLFSDNIPLPLTVDEYCDLLDSCRVIFPLVLLY